jgi:hypothetical protein
MKVLVEVHGSRVGFVHPVGREIYLSGNEIDLDMVGTNDLIMDK